MKIAILMPVHKSVNTSCFISFVDFIQDLTQSGHETKVVFTNGFNAAKARKCLARWGAEEGQAYDYLLWLDSDHVYKKEDFMALIDRMEKEGLNMLSACYKLHGCSDTAHGIVENDIFRHFKEEELKEDLIDSTVVGFGFLVMKSTYLKKLWDAFGDSLFVLDAKENCTEDVRFCSCVLSMGDRVCFDPKIKVGHVESAVRY
jgi:hypothetical protein